MDAVKDFRLPDLGEGLTEGTIAAWHVEVGDVITLNQTVAEIETAKAVVEVPSPYAGTITERFGEEGEEREVGTVLVRIDTSGGVAKPAQDAADGSTGGEVDGVGRGSGANGSTGLDADSEPQPLVGYGQRAGGGARRRRRRKNAGREDDGGDRAVQREGRPMAKPPVRKLAKDLDVDLERVAGSGPDGIITREDVRAAAGGGEAEERGAAAAASGATAAAFVAGSSDEASADRAAAAAGREVHAPAGSARRPGDDGRATQRRASPAPVLASAGAGEKAVPGFRGRTPGDVEQVTGVRRRIVEKMETSRREIPEATASRTADVTELWGLRHQLTTAAARDGFDVKITPFALVLRAVVLALRRYPTLNARMDREAGEIRLLEHINLGFAADTERGLVVPNIKQAESKSLLQLALELNRMAVEARDGRIAPGDLTGGTFTVTNYGAFGNDTGNPIINHPEAAILGVGAMREHPWVVDGELAVRRTCTFSLAFDHRISDGGEAGRFVTYVADLCEEPSRILLHS